jgi:hypothetical protein
VLANSVIVHPMRLVDKLHSTHSEIFIFRHVQARNVIVVTISRGRWDSIVDCNSVGRQMGFSGFQSPKAMLSRQNDANPSVGGETACHIQLEK